MLNKIDSFVSLVFVLDDCNVGELDRLSEFTDALNYRFTDYEVVLVGSKLSNNKTSKIDGLLSKLESLRYIELAKEYQREVTVTAGIENAIGDFVIVLDMINDPISLIDDFTSKGIEGCDILFGVNKNSNHNKVYDRFLKLVLERSGYNVPEGFSGSFCISRRALNASTEVGYNYWRLYSNIQSTGYKSNNVNYDFLTKKDKIPFEDKLRETFYHLVFNSTKPLRWLSSIGFITCLVSLFFSIYGLVSKIINNDTIDGWTSLFILNSIMFGLIFFILSFFSEYFSRLLKERSEHSEYNVVYEKNSSVMMNYSKVNVFETSVSHMENKTKTRRDK